MNALASAPAPDRGCRHCLTLALAASVVLAALRLWPEMTRDIWQDEATTLLFYARRGIWYPFTDYSLPNNHMLFSAVLATWWSQGDSVYYLRLLPALVSAVSVLGMLVLGARVVGRHGAALGLALFCASTVTPAFAVALRGYAFSWPCTLLLLASVGPFVRHAHAGAGAVFAVAAILNVAILPTNGLFALVAVVWAVATAPAGSVPVMPGKWRRAALALVASALGLLLYLPHAAMLARHAERQFSTWSDPELAAHWLLATLGNLWPLLPLFVLGLLPGAPATHADGRHEDSAPQLLAAAVGTTTLVLLVMPTAIFPRALVPALPLWYLALGGVLARGLLRLPVRGRLPAGAVAALLVALVALLGQRLPACAGHVPSAPGTHDLCQQFYRRDYHPSALLRAMEARFGSDTPSIMVDTEAAWGVGFAYWNAPRRPFRLIEWKRWPAAGDPAHPHLVITDTEASARRMLTARGLGVPRTLERLIDSGHFSLYGVHWR